MLLADVLRQPGPGYRPRPPAASGPARRLRRGDRGLPRTHL